MKMTNRWNRFIYRLWAPVYDAVLGRLFMPGRKRALQLLSAKPGERVLIVGVGTGEDLMFLPPGVEAVGIDDSPDMLAEARRKLPGVKASVESIQGDARTSRGAFAISPPAAIASPRMTSRASFAEPTG
jgi:phosphatidylethanolamine/phosphatidyl-N-methylethanolamine N-methyltransferase